MLDIDVYSICPAYIIAKQVSESLAEDLAITTDWTASLLNKDLTVCANIMAKSDLVLCGVAWVEQTIYLCDKHAKIRWFYKDGDRINKSSIICEIRGNARAILTAERVALNFLQTLSATSTQTALYVERIKGLQTKILDTRKTLPGLRLAQKYAVVVGGGTNHRHGLYDGVLIKDNHIEAYGSIEAVLSQANKTIPAGIFIQIEVENFSQLQEAIKYGAKLILLDNMTPSQIRQCVDYNQGRAQLEASGDINLDNILDYAQTGVDRISIGSLTKNIHAIDLSLKFIDSELGID